MISVRWLRKIRMVVPLGLALILALGGCLPTAATAQGLTDLSTANQQARVTVADARAGDGASGLAKSSLSPNLAAAAGSASAAARPTPVGTRTVPTRRMPTPQVTSVVTPTSLADAQAALSKAIQPIKGKTVRVSQAAGFTGAVYVMVPPALQSSLGAALSAGGDGYIGIYNTVNQAVTIRGAGSNGNASGALTLLAEPRAGMPANASDAQAQLRTLFPGISAPLTQVQASWATSATTYAFYGVSGNTAYAVGFVIYNGVSLAYATVGSGSYKAFVPKS